MPVKTKMIIINKEGVETDVPENYALQEGEVLKEQPKGDAPAPTLESDEIDYEKEYYALLEKEGKTAEERDNYKKGMLAAKGKLPELPVDDSSDLDALIEKKVQDTLLRTKEYQIQKTKDDLVKKVIQENKELKLAIANKKDISVVTPGGSVEKPEVIQQVWTKEQLEYFKKRGLNPDKVKENYSKFKSKA